MQHIEHLEDGLEIFKALGSGVRIKIIQLLLQQPMSMNELATHLQISNGALTTHIKKLEDCGLICTSTESNGHGNQKICKVTQDRLLIDLKSADEDKENTCSVSLKVGRYNDCKVYPTCGLATAEKLIGVVDDYRYFSHPDHFDADILWFSWGFVEYQVPLLAPASSHITQLTISAELSSEAPGANSCWPSDISFFINDIHVGNWTSPGDFDDVRGIFTPDWWYPNWNQYGLLKMLSINERGTFIDGIRISDVCISDLQLEKCSRIRLRFSVEEDAEHVGGLTIFGRSFGNYAQDIRVNMSYVSNKQPL
ncbi:MAG: ArsR/SmtB family transcription factor [Candidatus Onthomonas sp.]